MIYAYLMFAFGFYSMVASSRGRIVGIFSALLWPFILGMWFGWRIVKDDEKGAIYASKRK